MPAIPLNILSAARSAAIEKIRENDLDLGVAAAELPSTLRTVASVLRDIRNVLKRGRRLNPGDLAGEWLRYQYGIRPLMSDLYQAAEKISTGFASSPVANVKVVVIDPSYSLPTFSGLSYERTCTGSVRRGVEVSYNLTLTDPTAFELWRYGLTNPALIAWELVTLSFVADWFTGFGSFLGGLQRPLGIRVTSGYETRFLENRLTLKEQRHPNPTSTLRVTRPGWSEATTHTKSMRRIVLSQVATPPAYFKLGFNLNQALNLTALITSYGRRP
jgi:hypothetical protein